MPVTNPKNKMSPGIKKCHGKKKALVTCGLLGGWLFGGRGEGGGEVEGEMLPGKKVFSRSSFQLRGLRRFKTQASACKSTCHYNDIFSCQ